jgi:hypothetical protein
MPDFRDELTVISIGGQTSVDLALGFFARTVYVENFSNAYVSIPDIVSFVPPYTARLLALPGVQKAKMLFAAPPGTKQVASITGQVCNATWSELSVPVTGGPIGPIGVTSNYYDRNPTGVSLSFSAVIAPPDAGTVRWSYVAPANRKAFVESMQMITEIITVYPAGGLLIDTRCAFSGGAAFISAQIFNGNVVGARADALTGSSLELQPGDSIAMVTQDARAAGGSSYHFGSVKLTEFDA